MNNFAGYERTSGAETKYYTFNGVPVAVRTGSGSPALLYGDGVQSTVYSTSLAGTVTSATSYRAFGGTRRSEGSIPTDRRYTGQREDATGIYYFNARYYDPQIGQFISPDTIVPDPSSFLSYNRYLYANGNPLKYNDPSGHFTEEQLRGWYGDNWRDMFSTEWQQLLLDPGGQTLGAQFGDVISVLDGYGNTSQYVLALSASGDSPVLWAPYSKTVAPLAAMGANSPEALGLYRIIGGETGQPDNFWSQYTNGTKNLPATNFAADTIDGYYPLHLVQSYGTQAADMQKDSSISANWFMGSTSRSGVYVTNSREFNSLRSDLSTWAGMVMAGGGVWQMLVAGSITVGGATFTVGGAAVTTYQSMTYQSVYQAQPCPSFGVNWCR